MNTISNPVTIPQAELLKACKAALQVLFTELSSVLGVEGISLEHISPGLGHTDELHQPETRHLTTTTHRKIMSAARAAGGMVPRKVLLRLAGLTHTAGSNRNAVSELVRLGLLVQVGTLFGLERPGTASR